MPNPSRNRFCTRFCWISSFPNINQATHQVEIKANIFTWMNDITIATNLIQSHFNEIDSVLLQRGVRFILFVIYTYIRRVVTKTDITSMDIFKSRTKYKMKCKLDNFFFKYLCLLFLLIHFSIDRYYILCSVTYWCNSLDIRI